LRFGGMSLRLLRVELAGWLAGCCFVSWGCWLGWAVLRLAQQPACLVEDGFVIGVRLGCCEHYCLRGQKRGRGGVGSDWAVMGGLLWKAMYVDLEPARR
jgi:hypothetical protein